MIFLIGDTHGMNGSFKIDKLIRMNITSESDYLIICGDFGSILNIYSISSTIAFYSRLKCVLYLQMVIMRILTYCIPILWDTGMVARYIRFQRI